MAFFAVSLVLWVLTGSDQEHLESHLLSLEHATPAAFFTAPLIHVDGLHLTINLLIVLTAGTALELRWGTLRYLAFYFVCAAGGTGAALLHGALTGASGVSGGASAIAFGALAAVANIFATTRPVRPLPAVRYLAWTAIFAGGTLLAAVPFGEPPLVLLPHLAGVPLGLLFLTVEPGFTRRLGEWRARAQPEREPRTTDVRERVDELLQKISTSGYDSLSSDEKSFLRQASKHYRGTE